MRRRTITTTILTLGIVLVVVSYFFLSAPLGSSGIDNSNPRMQFAPALLVFGVILSFTSAIVYELLPDRGESESEDSNG